MLSYSDLRIASIPPLQGPEPSLQMAIQVYSALANVARATLKIDVENNERTLSFEDVSILLELHSWTYAFVFAELRNDSEVSVDVSEEDLTLRFVIREGRATALALSTRLGTTIGHYELTHPLSAKDLFNLAIDVLAQCLPAMGNQANMILSDPLFRRALAKMR